MGNRAYKIFIWILGCLLLAGGIAGYLTMVRFYENRFLPHTYLGNMNISNMMVDSVRSYFEDTSVGRSLEIKSVDSKATISLDDVDLRVSLNTDLDEIMRNQNPYEWMKSYFEDKCYDDGVTLSYDKEKMKAVVDKLPMISGEEVQPPEDARIELTAGGFILVSEINGNTLDESKVLEDIDAAIMADGVWKTKIWGNTPIEVDVSNDYVLPEITKEDEYLTGLMSQINAYVDNTITLDCVDATEKINKALISDWIIVNEDGTLKLDENGHIILDDTMIAEWVRQIAKKYSTLHMTREFHTHEGDVISLQNNGDSWGFVMKEEETLEAIKNALEAKEDATIQAVWSDARTGEGYGLPSCRNSAQGDIGDTYAEVSLDQQHMWLYKEGQLVFESDVVTGKPYTADANGDGVPDADENGNRTLTHTGVFFIYFKESPSTLTGSYGSTSVNYWMAITWDGEGFHDATWQAAFGGTRYKDGYGSHGCVNMPYDKARELYSILDYYTPVVIYQR